MRETLIQEIANLEEQEQIFRRDLQNALTSDSHEAITNELNAVLNKLSEKRSELADHESRIQSQQEQIDGLEQSVFELGLFEAIKQRPDDGERIFEYDEQRKEFNFIIIDFVREQFDKVHKQHNAEIGTKDEKIRALTMQGMETENQLAEAKKDVQDLTGELNDAHDTISGLRIEVESISESCRKAQSEYYSAVERIKELEAKLEQAQKPKEYASPTQELADRVAKLSQKSSGGMKTQLEIAMERYNLQLPELNPTQETPFRNEVTTSESGSDQLHPTDETTAVDRQFQGEESNIDGLAMGPLPLAGEATAVTREEFDALKSEVAQLKRTVFGEVAA